MTPRLTCEEARELAAEMALGTLAGDERARLISHIASCSECRTTVEELSKVADALLWLAPEREPPAGFESAFLAEFTAPVRKKRLRWVLSAAAVVVVALAAAGAVLWSTAPDRDLASHYRKALEEADGEYFGVRAVQTSAGTKVGNLFAYEGHPSWVFVVFDESVAPGEYVAVVTTTDGERSTLGAFTVDAEKATWGADLDMSLKNVAVVRFTTSTGETLDARM